MTNKWRFKPASANEMINNRLKRGAYSDYSIFLQSWIDVKRQVQHKISHKKIKAE
ncbi:hypothetical protein [Citrobacter sp. FP75]|uniref:hypothetical protein n=1 Tax=Citrobacter sp. FP75 TaxID=1852949 RepID=UPI001BC9C758|nr:hypothetical protein [Citrobacter sp. FP75]